IEAIISAAETGFTGSLTGLTRLAAYMGTMTGCFFCPEPPHWYRRPSASWINEIISNPFNFYVTNSFTKWQSFSRSGASTTQKHGSVIWWSELERD
uniref:Uncharacterized protein n=1 Tax=Sander lucioperca TaxID=283035 RepID=A0A8C9XS02_SANLU